MLKASLFSYVFTMHFSLDDTEQTMSCSSVWKTLKGSLASFFTICRFKLYIDRVEEQAKAAIWNMSTHHLDLLYLSNVSKKLSDDGSY